MTSCSVGEESRNLPGEFDGQVVGVACGLVVPGDKELTTERRNIGEEIYKSALSPAAVTSAICAILL